MTDKPDWLIYTAERLDGTAREHVGGLTIESGVVTLWDRDLSDPECRMIEALAPGQWYRVQAVWS